MRHLTATAVSLAVVLAQVGSGQDIKKVQEPEYLGTYFALEQGTGRLLPLERQGVGQKVEIHAMGFGGASQTIEIRGERSPVRFKEGQALEFVVLATSHQVDPQGFVQFFFFEPDDGKRKILTGKGSLGSG